MKFRDSGLGGKNTARARLSGHSGSGNASSIVFLLPQDDWWFCQDPGCTRSDRASGLQAEALAQFWLQHLKADPLRLHLLKDFVRSGISPAHFVASDALLVERIERMLMSGQLHLHVRPREVKGGVDGGERNVPFPLADRQPRAASSPPAVVDPPSFSPDADLAAQAAALVAAAASGAPFCLE